MCLDSDNLDEDDEDEVSRYINHPITKRVDQIEWWSENGEQFPSLYSIFTRLAAIPATSSSSERNFSTVGNVITDKRNMLLPSSVNDLIVARNRFDNS